MASIVSSEPLLRIGTVVARDCISATGREFEFMNMEAAVAKFLRRTETILRMKLMDVHLGASETTCAGEAVRDDSG